MRIVSYNILDGGEGRADPIAEVLLAQRADTVCLVEADNPEVLTRIARRLKMDFVHAPANKTGAALLSHWPIVYSVNHALTRDGMSRSFLEAMVRAPNGEEWAVGALHLHPRAAEPDESKREQELKLVLDVFATRGAHILAGDFNSNSPVQKIDPRKCKASTQKAIAENGGTTPRRVVQTLLGRGYTDTLHAHDPRAAESLGSFTTQEPGQRVDYIFAHGIPSARIKSAWIEQDRLAKYASDHFPVGAEFK